MHYSESHEQANETLRTALGLMGRNNIVPNPLNYTIWYEYASGSNSSLKAEMERFMREGLVLSPELHQSLFEQFILNGDQIDSRKIFKELQRIIEEIVREVKESGGQVARQAEKLEALVEPLKHVQDFDGIRKVIDFLIQTTRQILSSSQQLENKLSEVTVEVDTLREKIQTLKEKAVTDALTGLVNRWGLEKLLAQEMCQARETGKELSLIMADIDYFKKINDTFGHLVGDNVIKMFGAMLVDFVKGRDLVVRYGGEEFLIILPDTPLTGAVTLSGKMQAFLENMKWKRKESGSPLGKITLSFGVAQYRPDESIESFIQRADNALYYSKQNGRNRVTSEAELPLN